jgi:hypothetical protein
MVRDATFARRARADTDLPDGQINSAPFERYVQPLLKKYSDFQKPEISLYPLPSCPTEGRFANVTNAGRDAVDAAARLTGVACSGRRRRVVLTPRRWCQVGGGNSAGDGGKKADHRGERGISRKPLRAGMSGDFRWLAVNTRVHTYYQ